VHSKSGVLRCGTLKVESKGKQTPVGPKTAGVFAEECELSEVPPEPSDAAKKKQEVEAVLAKQPYDLAWVQTGVGAVNGLLDAVKTSSAGTKDECMALLAAARD